MLSWRHAVKQGEQVRKELPIEKKRRAGRSLPGVSKESMMNHHHRRLPLIVVSLIVKIKIIRVKR